MKAESRMVFAGGWGRGGKGQLLFDGCRVSIMEEECSRGLLNNTVLTLNHTTLHTQTQVDGTSQVICFPPHWKKHPAYFSSRKTGFRCNFHESSRQERLDVLPLPLLPRIRGLFQVSIKWRAHPSVTQTSAVFEQNLKTPGAAQTHVQCQRNTLLF